MPALIAAIIFLGIAMGFVVYNRQLAEYLAENFLKIPRWFYPPASRLEYCLVWFYRVFLYFSAIFCIVSISVYLFFLSS